MTDDKYVPLLFQDVSNLSFQIRLTNFICSVLFVLGMIGNILGLLIFSSTRRSWQISSVYTWLATCSSVANLLCLIRYTSVLHSASRYALQQLVGGHQWACKLYELSYSFRMVSAWITVFWMLERLLCVSVRLRPIFDHWNSSKHKFIVPSIFVTAIVAGIIGLPMYMFQPHLHRGEAYCGLPPNASLRWQRYFHEVVLGRNHHTIRCFFSELIPAGVVILINVYIIYDLRVYRRLYRPSAPKLDRNQPQASSWMNIVLILHSLLFLSSLCSHIIGHVLTVEAHETWWVSLAIVVNCSLNFYVYCLSGKAFRNEIRRFIQRVETRLFYQ